MTKTQIIDALGETGLLVPELVREGLAANDRIKYYLTLLQATRAHAEQPLTSLPDLVRSRESCGINDVSLDDMVTASRSLGNGSVFVPAAEQLRQRLVADMMHMLEPLQAAAATDEQRARYDNYRSRLDAALMMAPSWAANQIEGRTIDALTAAGDRQHDSLHRLVMDLHRELNRLQADIAPETVDGARASGLTDDDRRLVRAFMAGVNATRALKFDHPGLETTVARQVDHLSIQNDLGTTDAHVLVVRINGLIASVVYSDVHRKRLRFFRARLDGFPIDWTAASASRAADYEMVIGRFVAENEADLARFLAFLGSQLVYVIDWNRARKQLDRFADGETVNALMHWAARERIGHRGFLQCGGAALIDNAFQRLGPAAVSYGRPLDQVIGAAQAEAFLQSVLRLSTRGLQAGRSLHLIEDQVVVELRRYLHTSKEQVIDAVCDHAALMAATAERLQTTVALMRIADAHDHTGRTAALATQWESSADAIVRLQRRRAGDHEAAGVLRELLDNADVATDRLEEAAFLLTLIPAPTDRLYVSLLTDLTRQLSSAAREYVRAAEYARVATRRQEPSDIDNVLLCVERVAEYKRGIDAAQRTTRAGLVSECGDFRSLLILFETTRCLGHSGDALARCALSLRDAVLGAEVGQ